MIGPRFLTSNLILLGLFLRADDVTLVDDHVVVEWTSTLQPVVTAGRLRGRERRLVFVAKGPDAT